MWVRVKKVYLHSTHRCRFLNPSTGQNSFMFDVYSVRAVGFFSLKVTELLCRFGHGAVQP